MQNWVLLLLILGGTLLLIYLYGILVRKYLSRDYLTTLFLPYQGFDLWALGHLLLYILLGYLFPQWIVPLFLLGVAWEVIEQMSGDPSVRALVVGSFREDKWWYGRISDIFFNGVGLSIGYLLAT